MLLGIDGIEGAITMWSERSEDPAEAEKSLPPCIGPATVSTVAGPFSYLPENRSSLIGYPQGSNVREVEEAENVYWST